MELARHFYAIVRYMRLSLGWAINMSLGPL